MSLGLEKFLLFSTGPEIHGIALNMSGGDVYDDGSGSSQALTPITRLENAVAIDYSANSRKYTGTGATQIVSIVKCFNLSLLL